MCHPTHSKQEDKKAFVLITSPMLINKRMKSLPYTELLLFNYIEISFDTYTKLAFKL